ncbi:MAG TPA: DUF4339 domain-containing protein [Polyangiaceae bacterium]|nr:DUF4339 domain-containing protein [Polyangiaceae bacterium]
MARAGTAATGTWRWVDLDGTEQGIALGELAQRVSDEQLPPFVLVWRPGFAEWLPAYLVPELAETLGVDAPDAPYEDDTQTQPPPAPVEWYIECLGQSSSKTLARVQKLPPPRMLHLDWSDAFAFEESPTLPRKRRLLPVGAFPDIDAYLAHLRRLRDARER